LIVQFAGDEKFFIGSDYPHAEGFVQPMKKARELLAGLPASLVDKILGENARKFFGI
jgi:predicted TIM-barrel fold metal-dependent hydrolase